MGKATRAGLFGVCGIAYVIVAAAVLATYKGYTYYRRQVKCLTSWKETGLMLLEAGVLLSVAGYYVGDNLSDTEIVPERKRKTVSTVIIVAGLIGIYSFKFLHGLTETYKEKEENLIKKSLKEGRFSKSQWGERIRNKRNAKVYRLIYEFILEVFGLIPLIDGAYTALLEDDDPCENGKTNYFYHLLWGAWGSILLGLVIYSIIRVGYTMWQLTRQVIKIDQISVTNFEGKLENFGGTTTYTEGESKKIEIKGGATKSKDEMEIKGQRITILGGKLPNGENVGTTVIRDGQITAKGALMFIDDGSNATVTNENGDISNPNGTHKNNVITGGKTTVNRGTTKFTAKKAKISGAEVTKEDNPADKKCQYPEVAIEKRYACCCPLYTCASVLIAFLSTVCIGLFLVADNLQPLDCGIDPVSNIYSNYGLRIVFLVISLILYGICMALAIIFWVLSEYWAEKLPEAEIPQKEGGTRRRNGTPRRNQPPEGKPGIHRQGGTAVTMQLNHQGVQLNHQGMQINQGIQGVQIHHQGVRQLKHQGVQLNQRMQIHRQGMQFHHIGMTTWNINK